jgi:hypothetical protein
MTDGITILCSIYKTLEAAYCDNPLKSELLLRDQILKFGAPAVSVRLHEVGPFVTILRRHAR